MKPLCNGTKQPLYIMTFEITCRFDLSRSHQQCSNNTGRHITTQTLCDILKSGSKPVTLNATHKYRHITRQQLNLPLADLAVVPKGRTADNPQECPASRHLGRGSGVSGALPTLC